MPAVEKKRSGAADVAGIASTHLAMTPNQGKRKMHTTSTPLRILGTRTFCLGHWDAGVKHKDPNKALCSWTMAKTKWTQIFYYKKLLN